MRPLRTLALCTALPAVLALTACGGSTVARAVGQNAEIRFVHASPDSGNIDLYFQSTGTSTPTSPLIGNAHYGAISDFSSELSTASNVIVRAAGSSANSTPLLSCAIPQLTNNALYTIAIAGQTAHSNLACVVEQDGFYGASGQVRIHHIAPNAASTVTVGTYFPTFAGSATALAQLTFPTSAVSPGTGQTVPAQIGPTSISSSATVAPGIGFAVGAAGTSTGGTFVPLAHLDAGAFTLPNGSAATDPGNTIPGSGYNNASIFAIDCTPGSVAALPGSQSCANNVALIGSFDSK